MMQAIHLIQVRLTMTRAKTPKELTKEAITNVIDDLNGYKKANYKSNRLEFTPGYLIPGLGHSMTIKKGAIDAFVGLLATLQPEATKDSKAAAFEAWQQNPNRYLAALSQCNLGYEVRNLLSTYGYDSAHDFLRKNMPAAIGDVDASVKAQVRAEFR